VPVRGECCCYGPVSRARIAPQIAEGVFGDGTAVARAGCRNQRGLPPGHRVLAPQARRIVVLDTGVYGHTKRSHLKQEVFVGVDVDVLGGARRRGRKIQSGRGSTCGASIEDRPGHSGVTRHVGLRECGGARVLECLASRVH